MAPRRSAIRTRARSTTRNGRSSRHTLASVGRTHESARTPPARCTTRCAGSCARGASGGTCRMTSRPGPSCISRRSAAGCVHEHRPRTGSKRPPSDVAHKELPVILVRENEGLETAVVSGHRRRELVGTTTQHRNEQSDPGTPQHRAPLVFTISAKATERIGFKLRAGVLAALAMPWMHEPNSTRASAASRLVSFKP